MKPEEIEQGLAQFHGTERYYAYNFGKHRMYVYTDGVKFLVEEAQAHWLLDIIASYQPKLSKTKSAFTGEFGIPFQAWYLEVNREKKTGNVYMIEDEGQPKLIRQHLGYTDFPLNEIKLWMSDGVLMLPGEY